MLMPLALKYGLDGVIKGLPFPVTLAYFLAYGLFSLGTTYFDGRRNVESSWVVQVAWYKISLRAYDKMFELDL